VAIKCLQQSSAKDRKTILKTFKTYVPKIACEEYGHWVLLTCMDVVDDTVLLKKVNAILLLFPGLNVIENDFCASVLMLYGGT
jgi:pumilio family protein 6